MMESIVKMINQEKLSNEKKSVNFILTPTLIEAPSKALLFKPLYDKRLLLRESKIRGRDIMVEHDDINYSKRILK